jgi:hypothetical protein
MVQKFCLIIVSTMVTICLVSSNEMEATYITNTCKNNYWYVLKMQVTSHVHEMDPEL